MADEADELSQRITELGSKSGLVLLFLSFAMVSAATLEAVKSVSIPALEAALWWWKVALFPILFGILPMKEVCWKLVTWYRCIRWLRLGLLWVAVILISVGVASFFRA
jgi:hypothetical protein